LRDGWRKREPAAVIFHLYLDLERFLRRICEQRFYFRPRSGASLRKFSVLVVKPGKGC
jgi:hypothetical protein